MPSVRMIVKAENPVLIPAANEHVRQGILFRLTEENRELSEQLHHTGMGLRNIYKLFTFSSLEAEYSEPCGERIALRGYIAFEIRAVEPEVIRTVTRALLSRKCLCLGRENLPIQDIRQSDTTLCMDHMRIRMRTPVSIHHTDQTHHRHYVSPDEPDFPDMIDRNFRKKYESYTHEEPETGVLLRPVQPKDCALYMVEYKGIIVKGYYGEYLLSGKPEYLTFLYHAGLGVRTAQGFGMFDPVYIKNERMTDFVSM